MEKITEEEYLAAKKLVENLFFSEMYYHSWEEFMFKPGAEISPLAKALNVVDKYEKSNRKKRVKK